MRQQQTEADRSDHARLAKIVRPVKDVEPRTELDLDVFDRSETGNAQFVEPHTSRPPIASWLCSSLYRCASARVALDFSVSSIDPAASRSRRATVSLRTGGRFS